MLSSPTIGSHNVQVYTLSVFIRAALTVLIYFFWGEGGEGGEGGGGGLKPGARDKLPQLPPLWAALVFIIYVWQCCNVKFLSFRLYPASLARLEFKVSLVPRLFAGAQGQGRARVLRFKVFRVQLFLISLVWAQLIK